MRCNICFLDIMFNEKEIKCVYCLNSYHTDHLAAWLLTENHCPTCRKELSHSFREGLKPKNEKERKRLSDISRSLNSLSSELRDWEKKNKKKVRKIREHHEGVRKERIPMGKIIIPLIIFAIWMFALIIILD